MAGQQQIDSWDSDATYLVLRRRLARNQRSVVDSVPAGSCSKLTGPFTLDPAPCSPGSVTWPSGAQEIGCGRFSPACAANVQPGPTGPALTQVFKHWRRSLLLQRDSALTHLCLSCHEPGPRLGMGQVQAAQCNVKRQEEGDGHQQPPGQGNIPMGWRKPRAKRLGRAA